MASSATGLEQKAAEILEKTEIVASTPHALEPLVEPYPGDSEERPFGYMSIIALLQKQLQREASKDWELALIPRIYKPSPAAKAGDADDMDGVASEPSKHSFPNVMVPSPVNPGPKLLFPEAYFSLYADQEVEVRLFSPLTKTSETYITRPFREPPTLPPVFSVTLALTRSICWTSIVLQPRSSLLK